MDKEHSVLDGIPVEDQSWRLRLNMRLEVVSSCPTCGAPIYGEKDIQVDRKPPVKYSCECRNDKSFGDTL